MSGVVTCRCGWTSDPQTILLPTHCEACGAELTLPQRSSPKPARTTVAAADDGDPLAVLTDEAAFAELTAEETGDPFLAGYDEFGNKKPKIRGKKKRDKQRDAELELLQEEVRFIKQSAADQSMEYFSQKKEAHEAAREYRNVRSGGVAGALFGAFGFFAVFGPGAAIWALKEGLKGTPEENAAKDHMRHTKALAAKGKRAVYDLLRRKWALETISKPRTTLPDWVNNTGAGFLAVLILAAAALAAFLVSLAGVFWGIAVYVAGLIAARLAWWRGLGPIRQALRDYPALRRQKEDAFPRSKGYVAVCLGCVVFSCLMLAAMILLAVARAS